MNIIDSNSDTVMIYSFNIQNYGHLRFKLDLSHLYLNWNDNVYEMITGKEGIYIKEFAIDIMKVRMVVSSQNDFNIMSKRDGENNIYIWLSLLMLEYVMLY
jgi:hypothetical protein